MQRSMYSLMLSADVVSAIDRLAYQAGMNRSSMINRILAEYVSYRTPEMRMREMFETMEKMFAPTEGLKVMLRSSQSLFSLRSALAYKYNPTVNYSIELYRVVSDEVGELRASLRTQNSSLKLAIMQFYKLWAKLECSDAGCGDYAIDGEKFTKKLILRPGRESAAVSEQELSEAIVDYVCAFDAALKAFFYNLDDAAAAIAQVESAYKKYRASSPIIV